MFDYFCRINFVAHENAVAVRLVVVVETSVVQVDSVGGTILTRIPPAPGLAVIDLVLTLRSIARGVSRRPPLKAFDTLNLTEFD